MPDGATRREHLKVSAASGAVVPALISPPLPDELAYLLEWFDKCAAGRGSADLGGKLPLTWAEIDAWARLSGIQPTPFEVGILRGLDTIYLGAVNA